MLRQTSSKKQLIFLHRPAGHVPPPAPNLHTTGNRARPDSQPHDDGSRPSIPISTEDSSKTMIITGGCKLSIALLLALVTFNFRREWFLLSYYVISSSVEEISQTVSASIAMDVRQYSNDDRCLTFDQGRDLGVLMDNTGAFDVSCKRRRIFPKRVPPRVFRNETRPV